MLFFGLRPDRFVAGVHAAADRHRRRRRRVQVEQELARLQAELKALQDEHTVLRLQQPTLQAAHEQRLTEIRHDLKLKTFEHERLVCPCCAPLVTILSTPRC